MPRTRTTRSTLARATSRTRRRALLAGALSLSALATMAGCNYISAGMYLVGGGPKIEAVYSLDGSRTTVVFVDDRTNVVPRRSLRMIIGQQAEETLMLQKVLKPEMVIPTQSALRAVQQERSNEPMSIVDVGRAVGSDVVIYVIVDRFTLSREGVAYEPFAAGRAKVFDAANNYRMWPASAVGHAFQVEIPVRPDAAPTGVSERLAAEEALARRFGEAVAQLFYTREREGGPASRRFD
ncbi:MAG: hypothetical protein EA379_01900 [Phycisphaerales bacterium]|nr:MAG: hypothetical protein EA379_01900 [Phycisphaerales bacterium]